MYTLYIYRLVQLTTTPTYRHKNKTKQQKPVQKRLHKVYMCPYTLYRAHVYFTKPLMHELFRKIPPMLRARK